jgi:hypothetical protein
MIIIAALVALAVITALIFTRKPAVDDCRFFGEIMGKSVAKGELVNNGAMAVIVQEKSININIHPKRFDSAKPIEKIVNNYFPPEKRDEIIKAANDSCEAVNSGSFTDGAETYRYTSETGNSIYIRTWSNYGGTVYILITRGV